MPGELAVAGDPTRFGVLGPLEVVGPDGAAVPVGGAKQRALLTLLILYRNQAVSASRLVDGLWGDAPPRGAEVIPQDVLSLDRLLLRRSQLQQQCSRDDRQTRNCDAFRFHWMCAWENQSDTLIQSSESSVLRSQLSRSTEFGPL